MEVRNIHEHAGWFASYMNAPDGGNDEQGKALVECLIKKVEKLQGVIDTIKGEAELRGEDNSFLLLQSIEIIANQSTDVEHTEGYFKWIG